MDHQVAARRRNSGFTLMELMVVIALIAILSAALVPEMRGSVTDARLRSAGRQFVGLFHLAGARAVSRQQTHRVHLDRSTGRYALERQTSHNRRAPAYAPVREISNVGGQLDHRLSFELRRPTPVRNPSGGGAMETENPTGREENPETLDTQGQRPGSLDAVAFYPDGTADAAELILRDESGSQLTLRLNPITGRVQLTGVSRP